MYNKNKIVYIKQYTLLPLQSITELVNIIYINSLLYVRIFSKNKICFKKCIHQLFFIFVTLTISVYQQST